MKSIEENEENSVKMMSDSKRLSSKIRTLLIQHHAMTLESNNLKNRPLKIKIIFIHLLILFGYSSYFQNICIIFCANIALLILNGDNRHCPSTRFGTLTPYIVRANDDIFGPGIDQNFSIFGWLKT